MLYLMYIFSYRFRLSKYKIRKIGKQITVKLNLPLKGMS